MMLKDKFHLRIPGPTPVPPRVTQAMSQPMIGHRSSACSQLLLECSHRLKPIFGTDNEVLILTGSGTSALEAAVTSTVAPGEEAAVIVTGAFGARFHAICERFGIHTHRLDIPWGQSCSPEQLRLFLQKHPAVKAVFLTYCETSTGVLNPIGELAEVIRDTSDALIIVDGVSIIGAVDSQMDPWGVDILITGSQKAMMLPPGLAFAAVSEKAWTVIEQNRTPRYYLDLLSYRRSLEKDTTPATPAVSLLFGLKEALTMIEEEGRETVITRHQTMMEMTRRGLEQMGLRLMTTDADASPTVTAVYGGEGWEVEELRQELQRLHVVVAGGQQHLKGKIFRIGHMGYCDPLDILTTLSAIEIAFLRLGVTIERGAGLIAAQEVWTNEKNLGN